MYTTPSLNPFILIYTYTIHYTLTRYAYVSFVHGTGIYMYIILPCPKP